MATKGFAHEDKNNLSVDWYTPAWIFERMGLQFDLDPCAPTGGVPWIPAIRHYDLEDNGLTAYWFGKVWLNPPYGKETPKWLAKMHQHRNGMALLFARTDCAWFHDYVAKADAILFLKGRVKFVDGLGVSRGSGAGSGSMLIAWGSQQVEALKRMEDLGETDMSLELRPYQVEDLSFYIRNKKCLNRSDTGTGKTASVCVMFKYVSDYEHGSSIWVMPKSLLGKNKEELENWTGLSTLIYRGKPTKDKWRGEQFDVILTTADTLMAHYETIRLMLKKKLTLIVCDESHLYYSSITSKRCEFFVALSRKIDRVVFMTATVIRGRLDSAFPIIHVIEPRFYGHHRSFMDQHCVRDSFTNKAIGWRNSEKVGKILEKFSISHTFREVYGDKNLVYLPVSIELDPKHRKSYEEFEQMAMLELDDESVLSATEAGVYTIRCRQILTCPEVLGLKVAEICKDTWLFENILGGQFNRVVIFSAVVGEQVRLLEKVAAAGFSVELINGTVGGEKRVKIDEAFRRGNLQVIIASPATAGVGWNWQIMEACVFMSTDYLDDSFTQAVARGVRGVRETTLPIFIPQYQRTIEQKVLGIIQKKSLLAHAVDARKEILEGLIC